ncbi:MAG: twin-arginine translocase TatA/TatE family subunit [Verrucomicrobiota bacterium]
MILLGFFTNLFQGADGIILLFLVLLLFGAKRLPELARGLGSAINEFNKAKDDVHRQITQAAEPMPGAPVTPPAAAPAHLEGEPVSQHPLPPQQPPAA